MAMSAAASSTSSSLPPAPSSEASHTSPSLSTSCSSSSCSHSHEHFPSTLTSLQSRISALTSKYPAALFVQPPSIHILALHTIIRDRLTNRTDFVFYSDQLLRLLIEFSLSSLAYRDKLITTPTGAEFIGREFAHELCGVSILRAGESMEQALRSVIRSVKIGKILIQRDESNPMKTAKLFYSKLPQNINECQVLLLDPMLATGNSVLLAIDQLLSVGLLIGNIIFVNLISAPEGIEAVLKKHPKLKIVTGWIDEKLNEHKYIVPGVGDFGDRYFGT